MASFVLRTFIYFSVPLLISAQLNWTEIKPEPGSPLPPPRRDFALGYDPKNKQILLFGGKGSETFGDTWAFNLTSRVWKELSTTGNIQRRFSVVSGVWNNGFYVSTGELDRTFFNDIWRLDLTTYTWTELPLGSTRPEKRYGSTGGFFQHGQSSLFYLTHGFSDERYSNTFVYDVSKRDGWKEVFKGTNSYNPNYPHARCLLSGTMLAKQKMVIYGGCLGYVLSIITSQSM